MGLFSPQMFVCCISRCINKPGEQEGRREEDITPLVLAPQDPRIVGSLDHNTLEEDLNFKQIYFFENLFLNVLKILNDKLSYIKKEEEKKRRRKKSPKLGKRWSFLFIN